MTAPQMEPLSPVDVERRLRRLVTELTEAQATLRAVRDAEVRAIHEYKAAYRSAVLSPDCPRVKRDVVTTTERDAWLDERCHKAEFARDVATATREAAQDHLRVVRDQASVVQTLARSVQQAYSLAGMS